VQKAIEKQDKLIRHTNELKKALMQKLFTEGIKGEKQKQTEIGPVPESWEVIKFDKLFEIIKSQSHSRSKLTHQETANKVFNIHYGDIHSTFKNEIVNVDVETLPYILDVYNNETRNNYLQEGDIIIADASEDLIDIGKCIELKNVGNKKIIGGLHTIVARPKSNNITNGFGAFLFKHKHVADEIRYIATGLSVYGISKGNLLKMLIPIPPIKEQEVMAKTIININTKLEIQKKKKQILSDLFKTLLHELMTGERRIHEIEFEALKKEYKIKEQPLSMAAEN
jgi:type I restriction enzyme S subunit